MEWDATVQIHEHEYRCTAEIDEFNKTINQSIIAESLNRDELIGTAVGDEAAPLGDKRRMSEEVPLVSSHWRPQFAFPIQDLPDERLAETLYYIDYQGVRIISLDSNIAIEE